jgi:hypothetical protein
MINLARTEIGESKILSPELQAVLHIFSINDELRTKALPHVDIEKENINWFIIGRQHFTSGNNSAVMWARSIWLGRSPIDDDLLERSFSMDLKVRKSIVEALGIIWGLY